MQNLIKNQIELYKFKKAALVLALTASSVILSGNLSYVAYANIKLAGYSNDSQIEYIARELDCDLDYISKDGVNKTYLRMQHNGDEPVYVALSEKIDEEEKSIIIEALDYVFDIVGSIDDRYDYKLIDMNEYNRKSSKTRILFDLGTREPKTGSFGITKEFAGWVYPYESKLNKVTTKDVMNNFVIYRNEDFDISFKEKNVYIHELMHAFGFADVYLGEKTNKVQNSTFMNSSFGQFTDIITPNDYKCLLALYTKKIKDNQKIDQTIQEYKERVEDYEITYYNNYIKIVKDYFGIYGKIENSNFTWQGSISMNLSGFNSNDKTYYKIDVSDNKYTINLKNYSTGIEDYCEGEVYFENGFCVLKDVYLKYGFDTGPASVEFGLEGLVDDLVLAKNGGTVNLYSIASHLRIKGELSYTENESSIDLE